jgi:hypothetical protein
MRCLSLLPMVFRNVPWSAPLSRELLLFAAFSKSLSRSLRSLVEAIASSLLLRGDGRRARDDYLDISLSLPFQNDANTGMGVVVKCFLEALLTFNGGPVRAGEEENEDVKEAVEQVLEMVEATFDNVKDVRNELRRAFRFWDAVSAPPPVPHRSASPAGDLSCSHSPHVAQLMKATATLRVKSEESITPELVAQFEAADKWLKPMTRI